MKEFIEKLIGRLEEERKKAFKTYTAFGMNTDLGRMFGLEKAIDVVNQLAEEYKLLENIEQLNNGWIPCSVELPPQPEENPEFEGKLLELYMVAMREEKYPFRAFWNGRNFTDGISVVKPIAWKPLDIFQKGENK